MPSQPASQASGTATKIEPLEIPRRKWGKLVSYRRTMHDLLKARLDGKIDSAEASRMCKVVDMARRAKVEEMQIDLMEKGGIVGFPFMGATFVVAPAEATKTIEHEPLNGANGTNGNGALVGHETNGATKPTNCNGHGGDDGQPG